jgi:ribosomal protein L22
LAKQRKQNIEQMVEKSKNKEVPVTAEQSKDIMDDILGELDDQDEDDLKDVTAKNRGAGNVVQNQIDLDLIQDEEILAFNKND